MMKKISQASMIFTAILLSISLFITLMVVAKKSPDGILDPLNISDIDNTTYKTDTVNGLKIVAKRDTECSWKPDGQDDGVKQCVAEVFVHNPSETELKIKDDESDYVLKYKDSEYPSTMSYTSNVTSYLITQTINSSVEEYFIGLRGNNYQPFSKENRTITQNQTIALKIEFSVPKHDSGFWDFKHKNNLFSIDPDVGACGTLSTSGYYTMNQSVVAAGDCFTISQSNVTLDCAGFTIIFANSSGGDAINTQSGTPTRNVTIKNCVITTGNKSSTLNNGGIQFIDSTDGLATNNTITNNGGGASLRAQRSIRINFTYNTVTENASSSANSRGMVETISAPVNNTYLYGNTFLFNNSGSSMALISTSNTNDFTIENNIFTICNYGSSSMDIIDLSSNTIGTRIINNVFNDTCSASLAGNAVDLSTKTVNHTFFNNNTIKTSGQINIGLQAQGGFNNTVSSSKFFITSASASMTGMNLVSGSRLTKIINNTFNITTTSGTPQGIRLNDGYQTLIVNNTFNITGSNGDAILFSVASPPFFNYTNISNNHYATTRDNIRFQDPSFNYTFFIDDDAKNVTFTTTGHRIIWINSTAGTVEYLEGIKGGSFTSLSTNITIKNNSVYVDNVSNGGNLSRPANITLTFTAPLSFSNPVMAMAGIPCNETTTPHCYNFTALNSATIRFNVSFFALSVGQVINITEGNLAAQVADSYGCTYSTGNWIINNTCNISGTTNVQVCPYFINITSIGYLNVTDTAQLNASNVYWYPKNETAGFSYRLRWSAGTKVRWAQC